jgi:lipopolysaccharide export system permease protein
VKILSRYILRECLTFFGVVILAFTGILLTIRMLRFASLIINKGVDVGQIALVFVSIIPSFLEIALPLAALLGVMLAFARFSGDSEIIVIRASGISIVELIKPVVILGVLLWALSLAISLELRPRGFRQLAQSLFEIARTRSTAGLTEGVFNKLGDLTLYAEKIDFATGALTHVLIDDRRDRAGRKVISATSGTLVSDPTARSIVLDLTTGAIHEQNEERYSITRFVNNRFVFDPNQVLGTRETDADKKANELSLAELRALRARFAARLAAPPEDSTTAAIVATKTFAEAGSTTLESEPALTPQQLRRKINRIDIERERRFSMPFAAFVLALVGLPLGVQPSRSQKTWGAGISAALGLAVFVIYYGILSIGLTLAESGAVPARIALWLPNIAALGIAVFALHRIGTERWQSIAAGLSSLHRLIPSFRRPASR